MACHDNIRSYCNHWCCQHFSLFKTPQNHPKRLYFSDSISFDDLLGLATESMESAREFLDILFRYEAQPGIVAFNAFNFSLAERALQNAKSLGHYKLDRSDVRVATQSIRAV
ncbi:MAG: hypothetical protein VXX19_08795 [Planctomycetota bacterium]|nr:hypothetical protein [Planctomycetota bacterium]